MIGQSSAGPCPKIKPDIILSRFCKKTRYFSQKRKWMLLSVLTEDEENGKAGRLFKKEDRPRLLPFGRSRFRSRQPRAACRKTEGLCIRKRKRFHPESCSPGPASAGRFAPQRAPAYSRTGQKQTDKALSHLPHQSAVSQQKHLIPLQRFAADASKAAGRRIRLPAAVPKSSPIRAERSEREKKTPSKTAIRSQTRNPIRGRKGSSCLFFICAPRHARRPARRRSRWKRRSAD